jgi:Putative restriction endonuclease
MPPTRPNSGSRSLREIDRKIAIYRWQKLEYERIGDQAHDARGIPMLGGRERHAVRTALGRPDGDGPAGGAHGTLRVRLGAVIDASLRSGRPCMAQTEAGIVRPDRDDTYYVADLAVTCTPYQRGEQLVKDAVLIVEILSPGTERPIVGLSSRCAARPKVSKRSCLSVQKVFTPKFFGNRAPSGLLSWSGDGKGSFVSLRSTSGSRWQNSTKGSTSMPKTRLEGLLLPRFRMPDAT